MKFSGKIALTALVLSAALLGGCKKVQTTFVNTTTEELELDVLGPGSGTGFVGKIPAGGQLRTKIQVSPASLPATYTWVAGDYTGKFTIAVDMKPKIWVNIPMGATSEDPAWRQAEGTEMIGGDTAGPVQYK